MPKVTCLRLECIHNNPNHGGCEAEQIFLDEGGCNEYTNYATTEEYQAEYFKRMLPEASSTDKTIYKVKSRGKRIELNGFVVFTQSDIRGFERIDALCTEEKSGLFGRYRDFTNEEKTEAILKTIASTPDLHSLPEAECIGGKIIPLKEERS